MNELTRIATTGGVFLTLLASAALSQPTVAIDTRAAEFDAIMGFEVASDDALPSPWSTNGTVVLERDIVYSGSSAARVMLEAGGAGEPGVAPFPTVSGLSLRIPLDFAGTNIELRGYMRSRDVARRRPAFAAPRPSRTPLEDPIEGALDWTEFSVMAPIDPIAHTVELGVRFIGEGTIWVDDLQILVDGRPLRELPRINKLTEEEQGALIARAERSGPPSIARSAKIKTVFGGEIRVLREGTNGWTCWGETDGLGPMCNEPGWDSWLMAYWNDEDSFEVERLSTSYMLAAEGEPPHVMILVPDPATLEGLSRSGRDPIWAMWTDSPYAHIMLNTGDEIGPTPAANGYGRRRTVSLTLPPPPFIPFEPIEMSQTMLERYTGTYAPTGFPPALAQIIPAEELAERRESFITNATTTVSVEGNALILQTSDALLSQVFRPASETRFISGQDEIVFELDDEGIPRWYTGDELRFERTD